ncbi:MAG TPA: chorismate mutase [Bacillota bacterium]|nr:chorismate mutase [Bacillota bacterium]
MTRGIRGATTVEHDNEDDILNETKKLIIEMIDKNNVQAENVSHAFISVTTDLTATFPAKSLRGLDGWAHVPVMCMQEIDVPNSLEKCIRIMMVVNTEEKQSEVNHVFQNEAVKLRPDLVQKE